MGGRLINALSYLILFVSIWPGTAHASETAEELPLHEFYFSRGDYGGSDGEDWGPRWAVDYPEAEEPEAFGLSTPKPVRFL